MVRDHICGLWPLHRSVVSIYMAGISTTGVCVCVLFINITKGLSLVQEKVQICELKQHKSDKESNS